MCSIYQRNKFYRLIFNNFIYFLRRYFTSNLSFSRPVDSLFSIRFFLDKKGAFRFSTSTISFSEYAAWKLTPVIFVMISILLGAIPIWKTMPSSLNVFSDMSFDGAPNSKRE